jgi:CRISPR-associated endonuclease/helicase Cas3
MREAEKPFPELSRAEFGDFFEEVHGYRPFPWQEKLVAKVLDRGWPESIDVPTGLGKTAVLDAAVFLNALGNEHARRRVFLVVDRRIIVDQAHDEAEKIRRALEDPPPGSVRVRVRARLAVPGDEEGSALDVTRMRGGVNWSWRWIERPDRHAIITGTVDQIGSRLLFRGYGVGERLRPIDAAMVGTDSLVFIDEAHLSDPFLCTFKEVLAMDADGAGRRPIVVTMSASLESTDGKAHGITDDDAKHPVAGKRLSAPKSVHPVEVTATAQRGVADALAYWARQLGGPGKVIGVVTNTVHMARSVFEDLRQQAGDENCVLLTGRVRPIDREYLLASWYPRIKSGADRNAEAELYVVATQTIEAGADIDLDGMVTQTASLSAFVQRLGRVNRMGERDDAHVVVVHAGKHTDPIYGSGATETWRWLASLESPLTHKVGRSVGDLGPGLDGSPARLRDLVRSISLPQQAQMRGLRPQVPVIFRSSLDTWSRTSPTPHPDIPVAPYLHGLGAGEPTVSLVWRADLRGDDPQAWIASVDRMPPSADEAIELPVSSVRRWLRQIPVSPEASQAETNTSDLESQPLGEADKGVEPRRAGPPVLRRVLRYRGADDRGPVTAQQIQPGDFVVVPSHWGGCDRYGWHPGSGKAVIDLADFTGWRGRRTTAIRIGPVFVDAVRELAPDLLERAGNFVSQVTDDIANESTGEDREYREFFKWMTEGGEPSRLPHERQLPHERVFSRLAERGHLTQFNLHDEAGPGSTRNVGLFSAPGVSWNEDESAVGSSAAPRRLTLAEHQAAVARRAREFASNLCLPEALTRAVEQAALHHDEGKRDCRFQVVLHGGDRLRARAMADLPLAKSGMDPSDRAAFRRAARLSGYPKGMRHEALSERIAATIAEQVPCDDTDKDLVVHLVAAHHGFSRPLLPPIVDEHPVEVRFPVGNGKTKVFSTSETVSWAAPERFKLLCERYGRWGLALLESIVRLADMWCSDRSESCDDQS